MTRLQEAILELLSLAVKCAAAVAIASIIGGSIVHAVQVAHPKPILVTYNGDDPQPQGDSDDRIPPL